MEYEKILVKFYNDKNSIYVKNAIFNINDKGIGSIHTRGQDFYFRMCDVRIIICNNYDIDGFNVKN